MGALYREALPEIAACIVPSVPIHIATGTIGRQLGLLHDWLYGEPPAPAPLTHESGTIRIRGVELSTSAADALSIARDALAVDCGDLRTFQSWYVPIDGQRVAPKWLVSRLTGLPVRGFTTDEARRVLARIGVPVRRA
jgi:hypothetical protein